MEHYGLPADIGKQKQIKMRMCTTILAVILSLLFAFDVSANESNIKDSPENPLNVHTKIQETDAVALNGKAEILFKSGEYLEAIKILNKALDLDSEYATGYYNRGWTYFQTKQYYRSIEDFDKAIGLEPKYLFAYNSLFQA